MLVDDHRDAARLELLFESLTEAAYRQALLAPPEEAPHVEAPV